MPAAIGPARVPAAGSGSDITGGIEERSRCRARSHGLALRVETSG